MTPQLAGKLRQAYIFSNLHANASSQRHFASAARMPPPLDGICRGNFPFLHQGGEGTIFFFYIFKHRQAYRVEIDIQQIDMVARLLNSLEITRSMPATVSAKEQSVGGTEISRNVPDMESFPPNGCNAQPLLRIKRSQERRDRLAPLLGRIAQALKNIPAVSATHSDILRLPPPALPQS